MGAADRTAAHRIAHEGAESHMGAEWRTAAHNCTWEVHNKVTEAQDVKLFREVADFSVLRQNNGAARLQGATKKAHWAIVEDVDIIIGGFYCGNYSPLNNSRIQGSVDIGGSMSKSGRTWSYMIDYLGYCDSVKRLVVEN